MGVNVCVSLSGCIHPLITCTDVFNFKNYKMIPTWLEIFLVLQLLDKKPTHFGFSYSSFSFIFFNKETNWPILIFSDLFCFVVFGSRPHSVIIQGILKKLKDNKPDTVCTVARILADVGYFFMPL